jgi:hypothetical protein
MRWRTTMGLCLTRFHDTSCTSNPSISVFCQAMLMPAHALNILSQSDHKDIPQPQFLKNRRRLHPGSDRFGFHKPFFSRSIGGLRLPLTTNCHTERYRRR